MRTIFCISVDQPYVKDVGAFTNKAKAYDVISNMLTKDTIVTVDPTSDLYVKFAKKQFNYSNLNEYFKDAKNAQKLVLRMIDSSSQSETPIVKIVRCTMFILNQSN